MRILLLSLLISFSLKAVEKTEQDFQELIDNFEETFLGHDELKNNKLVIKRFWKSSKVNAYAYRGPGVWGIKVYGGLYRFPGLDEDGFSLILCHELGHHLAGPPLKKGDWSSFEGQADYWSTHACLKQLWRDEQWYTPTNSEIVSLCYDSHFPALCERIINASLNVTTIFGRKPPSLLKKDPNKVRKSYPFHLEEQCRLDTFVSGALCEEKSCSDNKGAKPRCWFNPKEF